MAGEALPEKAETPTENIKHRSIEIEMQQSFIDYAMSVIMSRALPDVRDGLKPVHRRILYSMSELGLASNKAHKKSARIVGEVLGKYHPHGDTAVYDAMVRMAQEFSLRYPLVDGQGNFGSVDGDSPAAMRYTEVRLAKMAEEMLEDIQKDTVVFTDNFDATLKEPLVLPAKLPNLLINGSSGIAVGMATNIPPHNLNEVCDAVILLIDNPDADIIQLMDVIKGPDFPTGGIVYGISGLVQAYNTGRGIIRVRAKTHIEEMEHDKKRIIVSEIPYQVNKAHLIESIAELVRSKKIDGITDLRDESDREGMRIVIELRRDAIEEVVLNQLFAHTQMESTFGIINLALVDDQPMVLTLKDTILHHIDHRRDIVRRRTQFDLEKAKKRAHIVEGLLVALDHLDEVIKLIRRSDTAESAKNSLMRQFILTEEQAKAILDMRLQKLTGIERKSLSEEYDKLRDTIRNLSEILADESKILGIIKDEVIYLKEKYGDERRTEIERDVIDLDIEDLIPVEDVVVTITNSEYVKRIPVETYRMQRRGGVGLVGMGTKEEDYVVDLFVTSTHDYILFFTNMGKVHWLKAYRTPAGGRHSKGKPIVNLIPRLAKGEHIHTMIPVKDFQTGQNLIFATRNGTVKKTRLSAYSRPRVTGIKAINLDRGDELVETKLSSGDEEVILATKKGLAVRFNEKDVRPTGRATRGVRGVRLREGDELVSMALVREDAVLLTVTENGYGKRTPVSKYRKIKRGGKGVITIKTTQRNGDVVAVKEVSDEDELIITSVGGMVIRMPVGGISVQSRNTMGVRIMRLRHGDKVAAVARLARENEEEKNDKIAEDGEEKQSEPDDTS